MSQHPNLQCACWSAGLQNPTTTEHTLATRAVLHGAYSVGNRYHTNKPLHTPHAPRDMCPPVKLLATTPPAPLPLLHCPYNTARATQRRCKSSHPTTYVFSACPPGKRLRSEQPPAPWRDFHASSCAKPAHTVVLLIPLPGARPSNRPPRHQCPQPTCTPPHRRRHS